MKTEKQNQKTRTQKDKKILNRPENKDNLDSRQREEQMTQGNKMTHNAKQRKSEKKSD